MMNLVFDIHLAVLLQSYLFLYKVDITTQTRLGDYSYFSIVIHTLLGNGHKTLELFNL